MSDPHMRVEAVEPGQEFVGQVTGFHYVVKTVTESSIELVNQHTGETEIYSFEKMQEALNVPTIKIVGSA
jgi:hypothetical protein